MVARNNNSEGRKNYYSVSYGQFSNKVKEVSPNLKEITEDELKKKTFEVVNVDLRNTYINKGEGERPFVVFYDSITGVIQDIKKNEGDNFITLEIPIIDEDGELSVIQSKFYSKYSENLLNRLLQNPVGTDVQRKDADLTQKIFLSPYAIPNESDIEGKKVKFYTQGIAVKQNGVKIEPLYKPKQGEKCAMPDIERVVFNGKATTSRDKRVDWLFKQVVANFSPVPVGKYFRIFDSTFNSKSSSN